ncbi:unnamed protein product [Trichobilharzia regenti]|nr:unnamed protein product [Trichobilharzia regenti]
MKVILISDCLSATVKASSTYLNHIFGVGLNVLNALEFKDRQTEGQMYIEYQKLDFFLNQNLSLFIKDDICATIIDFTRPTPEEIKTKTGHRNVTE